MNGTCGHAAASACTSSGCPNRASKRLGSPSFFRAPTESTPQWTNTAAAGVCAASLDDRGDARVEQGVAVHRRKQAHAAKAVLRERRPRPLDGTLRRAGSP